jgi:hypothetical protein
MYTYTYVYTDRQTDRQKDTLTHTSEPSSIMLLYMCPHAAIYVSSYCCDLILQYICPGEREGEGGKGRVAEGETSGLKPGARGSISHWVQKIKATAPSCMRISV